MMRERGREGETTRERFRRREIKKERGVFRRYFKQKVFAG